MGEERKAGGEGREEKQGCSSCDVHGICFTCLGQNKQVHMSKTEAAGSRASLSRGPVPRTREEAKLQGFYSCKRFSEKDLGKPPELHATAIEKTDDSQAVVWSEAKIKLSRP